MGRQPCCDKIGLKKGPWTIEEDRKLINFIANNGIQCWRMVPKLAGLLRCGKSCRLRWINYLRPDLKRGALSEAEENQIVELHARLGNRWSKIASHFPGRTDNEIKNQWNTRIKKRLKLLGLDPVSHKPMDQTQEKIEEKNSEGAITKSSSSVLLEESQKNLDFVMQESLDMKLWMKNQEINLPNSCSPSFSTDSLNPSAIQEEITGLQQWVDSVDSIFSWDWFNQLEEEFFLLENSQ